MKAKLASVIIPTWNRDGVVIEAVESAKKQTWPHTEIIVVDDGSEDDTVARLSGMPGVRYFRQQHRGQGAARNLGLFHARGDYIATLDSDDLWEPEFLDHCIHGLEGLRADWVFANWRTLKDTSCFSNSWWEKSGKWKNYPVSNIQGWRVVEPGDTRKMVLNSCPSPSSSLVFHRQSIDREWNELMHIADDWCLLIDLASSKPCRTAFTMECLWTKRWNGDNLCDGADVRRVAEDLYLHDSRLMFCIFSKRLDQREKSTLSHHITIGNLMLSRNCIKDPAEWKEGIRLLISSLATDPAFTVRHLGKFLIRRFTQLQRWLLNKLRFSRNPLSTVD